MKTGAGKQKSESFHGHAWKVSPRRMTPARAGSGGALRIDDPRNREDRLLPFLSVCVPRR